VLPSPLNEHTEVTRHYHDSTKPRRPLSSTRSPSVATLRLQWPLSSERVAGIVGMRSCLTINSDFMYAALEAICNKLLDESFTDTKKPKDLTPLATGT